MNLILVGYVAIWWLAVWIVFPKRFGNFIWIPVAYAAFGVPMFVADLTHREAWRDFGYALMTIWVALPLAIDAIWGINQLLKLRGLRLKTNR